MNNITEIISIIDEINLLLKFNIAKLFNQLELGINSNQYAILETIYKNDGFYQRELTRLILKERSMIARTLNKLESLGFIERSIGINNNRLVKKVFITQKGRNIVETNQQNLKNIFINFQTLTSDADFAVLIKLLRTLKNSLK